MQASGWRRIGWVAVAMAAVWLARQWEPVAGGLCAECKEWDIVTGMPGRLRIDSGGGRETIPFAGHIGGSDDARFVVVATGYGDEARLAVRDVEAGRTVLRAGSPFPWNGAMYCAGSGTVYGWSVTVVPEGVRLRKWFQTVRRDGESEMEEWDAAEIRGFGCTGAGGFVAEGERGYWVKMPGEALRREDGEGPVRGWRWRAGKAGEWSGWAMESPESGLAVWRRTTPAGLFSRLPWGDAWVVTRGGERFAMADAGAGTPGPLRVVVLRRGLGKRLAEWVRSG